jgi:hypothetical protein
MTVIGEISNSRLPTHFGHPKSFSKPDIRAGNSTPPQRIPTNSVATHPNLPHQTAESGQKNDAKP